MRIGLDVHLVEDARDAGLSVKVAYRHVKLRPLDDRQVAGIRNYLNAIVPEQRLYVPHDGCFIESETSALHELRYGPIGHSAKCAASLRMNRHDPLIALQRDDVA